MSFRVLPDFLRGLLLGLTFSSPFSFPPSKLVCLCLKSGKGPLGGRDGRAASAFRLNRATKFSVLEENLRASNVGMFDGCDVSGRTDFTSGRLRKRTEQTPATLMWAVGG